MKDVSPPHCSLCSYNHMGHKNTNRSNLRLFMSNEVVVYYGLVNNEEKIKPQTNKHKDDHRCKWRINTMITNIILWGYIKDLLPFKKNF